MLFYGRSIQRSQSQLSAYSCERGFAIYSKPDANRKKQIVILLIDSLNIHVFLKYFAGIAISKTEIYFVDSINYNSITQYELIYFQYSIVW